MSDENEAHRKTAREEFEQARERYYQMRQQERDMRHQERDLRKQERDAEREANQRERERSRDERRTLRDEIRRGLHTSLGNDLGHHIGRSIRESMSFKFDLGDLAGDGLAGGDEYSELVEREFTVGHLPRLHVHNVSGDTKIAVGLRLRWESERADHRVEPRADGRVRDPELALDILEVPARADERFEELGLLRGERLEPSKGEGAFEARSAALAVEAHDAQRFVADRTAADDRIRHDLTVRAGLSDCQRKLNVL